MVTKEVLTSVKVYLHDTKKNSFKEKTYQNDARILRGTQDLGSAIKSLVYYLYNQ